MKQEVAELSGNFYGELSPLDGGEGVRRLLLCVKNKETHGAVCKVSDSIAHVEKWAIERFRPYHERTPCTSIAKTVQKFQEENNERITENQNQAESV